MAVTGALHSGVKFGQCNSPEQEPVFNLPEELRADQRFPLDMELRFSYRSGNVTYIGTGRIRNISSGAVCFEIDQEVRNRTEVELRIAWPSRLQRICPLELVVRGLLFRRGPNVAVVKMEGYEFQTHGESSFNPCSDSGLTCDIAA